MELENNSTPLAFTDHKDSVHTGLKSKGGTSQIRTVTGKSGSPDRLST